MDFGAPEVSQKYLRIEMLSQVLFFMDFFVCMQFLIICISFLL